MPNCRFAYPRGGSSMSSVGVVDWLNAADTGHPSQSTPSMGGNAAPCGVDGSAGSLLRSFARTRRARLQCPHAGGGRLAFRAAGNPSGAESSTPVPGVEFRHFVVV